MEGGPAPSVPVKGGYISRDDGCKKSRNTGCASPHPEHPAVPQDVEQSEVFFDRSGGLALARGTGFLARFLVAWPESTQGFRPFSEPPMAWPALSAFHRRIAAILANPVPMDEEGVLSPAVLTLAPDAKAAWVTFHDAIEGELPNEPAPQLGSGPFSETPHPPAVALSKSSENRAPSTLWRCGALKGGLRAVSSG
jgi:hypothetical protein